LNARIPSKKIDGVVVVDDPDAWLLSLSSIILKRASNCSL
jgi:hypothetical protein